MALGEVIRPDRRPPWIPFTEQRLRKGHFVGLVTVVAVDGRVGCALGDRFAYDDHLHGLQPMDRALNVAFGRGVEAARSLGRPLLKRVEHSEGAVEIVVEPWWPVGASEGRPSPEDGI